MGRRRILPLIAAASAAVALGAIPPGAQTPTASPSLPPTIPSSSTEPPRTTAAPGPPVAVTPSAPVSLVADSISIDPGANTVTAEGNVEIQFDGRILRADRIVYFEETEAVEATGPLVLVDPEVGVLFAEQAALTVDFTEGVIASARLLVAGVMQIAAAEVRRTEGRYTILHRTIASSCEVCPGDAAPTWAIRADRVIRDEETQQIHFRNATLELFGLPVAWLPYLRIADPSVARASGVLTPEFQSSSIYGIGIRVPYYQVLGPSADLTLTPFITERAGVLLEGEYRRRFRRGSLDIAGVFAPEDELGDRGRRGTLSAIGHYDVGFGFRAELDAAIVSDEDFLRQFDYSTADRLTSTLRLVRFLPDERFELATVGFQSLRPQESSDEIPLILPEFRYRRNVHDAPLGGRIGVEADALGILRDGGRDVLRFGGGGDWHREEIVGPGILASLSAGADLDAYFVQDDPGADDRTETRLVPWTRAQVRWPFVRSTPRITHVIEPVVDLAWSDALGDDGIPNEDSLLPEFDETNLFVLDRFPGRDRVETGLRANVGIAYSVYGTGGRSATATLGRVVRFSDTDQFDPGAGLSGRLSDWVGAVEVFLGPGFSAFNRTRFDDNLEIARNEFGFTFRPPRASINASWYYLAGDAQNLELGPQPEVSEVALSGRYRFRPNWEVRGNWRYITATDQTFRAGGGLAYGNECAEVDLSITSRFTPTGNVPPSTSIGFVVRIVGLGGTPSQRWPRRTCNG
jgi:LPS-assembly protein